jgi:glucosamine--fructose-6-phosphate aminotransferase (isomerizing)
VLCGIFGMATDVEKQLGPTLIEAGRCLSYRGYDTVGCATFKEDHTIDLRKDVGCVDDVARRLNFAELHSVASGESI